jgi:hypothetical protein
VSAPPAGAGAETVHCWQRTERARRESIARARQREPAAAYSVANNVTPQWSIRIVAVAVRPFLLSCLALAAALAGCESATLPLAAGTGPQPQLPAPHKTLLPTVNIAPAKGWPAGDKPVAAAGLAVTAYATGLDHPR